MPCGEAGVFSSCGLEQFESRRRIGILARQRRFDRPLDANEGCIVEDQIDIFGCSLERVTVSEMLNECFTFRR